MCFTCLKTAGELLIEFAVKKDGGHLKYLKDMLYLMGFYLYLQI